MILLVDRGNTRLKWVFHEGGGRSSGKAMTVECGELPDLEMRVAAHVDRVDRVLLSSVGAETSTRTLVGLLEARTGRPVEIMRVVGREGLLTTAYCPEDSLGVDRWLAMLGTRGMDMAACLVVDAGTALTVDAVDKRGRHLGGFIVPGIRLQQAALGGGTAAVGEAPFVSEEAFVWGGNTAAAVSGGIMQSLGALVQRCFIELEGRVEDTPRLILTGGDAGCLSVHAGVDGCVVPDLVFRGMLIGLDPEPQGMTR